MLRKHRDNPLASSNNNFGFQGRLTGIDVPGKDGLMRNRKLLANINAELCLSAKNILYSNNSVSFMYGFLPFCGIFINIESKNEVSLV